MDGQDLLKQLSPTCQPLFWDLAEHSPQELLQGTGEWLKALALVRAEREESGAFHSVFTEVLKQLDELAARGGVRWHDLMAFDLSWALRRRPEDNSEFKRAARERFEKRLNESEVQIMSQVLGQSWESWLLEKGEAQGFVKGKAEGAVRTLREALRELLVEKFGQLPVETLAQIDAASEAPRLKAALRQIVHITSLGELIH